MIDRTEETPGTANLTFSCPDEEPGYKAWVQHLAGELDFLSSDYAASHTNCVGVLVGDDEDPGQLYPDEDGYPANGNLGHYVLSLTPAQARELDGTVTNDDYEISCDVLL